MVMAVKKNPSWPSVHTRPRGISTKKHDCTERDKSSCTLPTTTMIDGFTHTLVRFVRAQHSDVVTAGSNWTINR